MYEKSFKKAYYFEVKKGFAGALSNAKPLSLHC